MKALLNAMGNTIIAAVMVGALISQSESAAIVAVALAVLKAGSMMSRKV